ncbi:MAG: hypothetical protein LIP77_09035 [Planctomycetes bacterium]|nr:hypothetical protein [Planctomycetota bacterium]
MSCPSCGFENLKSAASCGRCGAKLIWEGRFRKLDFQPPRAPRRLGAGWQRRIDSWLTRLAGGRLSALAVFRRIPPDAWLRGLASAVPGLGIVLGGQVAVGLAFFGVWLVVFLLMLALYPGLFFAIAPSLLALIHVGSVTRAMRPLEFCRTTWEYRVFALAVLAAVLVVYLAIFLPIAERTVLREIVIRQYVH